ncbi:hypothetical protein NUACC26_060020 [Scytonema sp. NUACC26]
MPRKSLVGWSLPTLRMFQKSNRNPMDRYGDRFFIMGFTHYKEASEIVKMS